MLDSWKKIIGNAWRGSTAHCSFPATGNEDYNHSPIIQVKVCFLQKCMKQSVRELGGIYNGIYNLSHLHSYFNNNLHFYLNRSDCQAINNGDWHCWRPILSVEAAKPRTSDPQEGLRACENWQIYESLPHVARSNSCWRGGKVNSFSVNDVLASRSTTCTESKTSQGELPPALDIKLANEASFGWCSPLIFNLRSSLVQ